MGAKKMAYLIPEFPGQTHSFFLREMAELEKRGYECLVVSTRRPATNPHGLSHSAESRIVYLATFDPFLYLGALGDLLGYGPRRLATALSRGLAGCTLRRAPRVLPFLLVAACLRRILRKAAISHVHVHSCADALLIAMLANQLGGVTYSMTLHNQLSVYGPQQPVKWQHARFAIVVSKKILEEVRSALAEFAPADIVVAPMGVDLEIFRRTSPYRCWRRPETLRLFSCGRLNRVKGHDVLLDTVALLRKEEVKVELKIAGEDEVGGKGYRRHLEKRIHEMGLADSVRLLGAASQDDVRKNLEAAHIFVLASRDEGVPVAVMEAMSMETPVVATAVGGTSELVVDGVHGLTVPAESPIELRNMILLLASNATLAFKLTGAALKHVSSRFSSRRSAIELERLLVAHRLVG